jgi:aminopeptidase N
MYFDALASVWETRTMEIAQSITMGLYPALAVSQETVDLTTAYLDRDMNAALRRLLSEGRDGVERAMRARAKDA